MLKLTFITTSLDVGGAEIALFNLLQGLNAKRFQISVVVMQSKGQYGEKLLALGIPVVALDLKSGANPISALLKLIRVLRAQKPDLIQGWMLHGNLAAGIVGKFFLKCSVAWSIHHTSCFRPAYSLPTSLLFKLGAYVSGVFADTIVYASDSSRIEHVRNGYQERASQVILNGLNMDTFAPDRVSGANIRRDFQLNEKSFVVGMVGRYHPQKDVPTFIKATRMVLAEVPEARFVLCGLGLDAGNVELSRIIEPTTGISNFRLLGTRTDVPQIMNAFDVFVLSSRTEAAPMVLVEAMACQIPCVATDVGDCRAIVGETGFVVQPENPEALARAIVTMAKLEPEKRSRLGTMARARVKKRFGIENNVARYETLFLKLAGNHHQVPDTEGQ